MPSRVPVAVYGAAGYTGSLVVAELASAGIDFIVGGRNRAGLEELARAHPHCRDVIPVSLEDGAALRAFTRSVHIVIHCGGPFAGTQRPMDLAGLDENTHVVSLAGEASVLDAQRTLHERAVQAGVALVAGAAFCTLAWELAAWLVMRSAGPSSSLHVAAAHAVSLPSLGSLRSYLAEAEHPRPTTASPAIIAFPPPHGPRAVAATAAAELHAIARSVSASSVRTSVAVGAPQAAAVGMIPALQDRDRLAAMVAARESQGTRGPAVDERGRAAFSLVATATEGAHEVSLVFQGADAYAFSARAAVLVATALLREPRAGVLTALQAIDPQEGLAMMARAGVRWSRSVRGPGEPKARG